VSEAPAIDYGRQFAGFYDRLFPPGDAAEQTAARLAELHPGDGSPALELGVGTGRIALPLSERTGEVVGVDLSRDMLDVLRAALERAPRPVTPVRGDIRDHDDGRRYGLVYCVCATLSMVLDEAGQRRVLEACARAAAPGAAVVIETHNPSGVEAMHDGRARETFFVPYPGQDTGLLSHSTLDRQHRLWQLSHVWFEDGRSRVASEVSRLTTPEEIDAYATGAGLRPEARYGDWQGAPLTGPAPTMVCVYRA
jgi:SAM-dependent methyltransferase